MSEGSHLYNSQIKVRRHRKPLPGGGVRMNPALETLYRAAQKADDDFPAQACRELAGDSE